MREFEDGSPTDQKLTTYTVLPAVKMKEATNKARGLLAALQTWDVVDAATEAQAGELLKQTHGEIKALDKLRLEVGKPARDAQKDINAFFEPPLKAYKEAKGLIKRKLEAHKRAIEQANRAAAEEAARGNIDALGEIVPDAAPAGVRYQDELVIKVVDFGKVPREYLCVDMSALKILARAGGEAPPGVVFERKSKAVVGR